jgi:transcriptional regulator with XRE-family HTH domain
MFACGGQYNFKGGDRIMTPFGEKVRDLRADVGVTLKQMAAALEVSPAYLSALEHGHRGRPSPGLIRQICTYFDIIWDDAEELRKLSELSHPKVTVDTSGLSARHTELANRLAQKIRDLTTREAEELLNRLG